MADMKTLKQKAKDALHSISDVSKEAYKLAEEKTLEIAKKTKMKAEISREKSHIRQLQNELGKLYYEQCKDNPVEELKQHVEEITAAFDRIAAKRKELEDYLAEFDLQDDPDDCDCGCDDEKENQEEQVDPEVEKEE
jgi:phenylalanyl-tRNA synthetase alpha subunit